MSIRIANPWPEARRGVDMLRSAQHLIVEAAAIIARKGRRPGYGRLSA